MTAKPDIERLRELLPCDFCGDKDPSYYGETGRDEGVEYGWTCVECDECGARGPKASTAEAAKVAWNTRTTVPRAWWEELRKHYANLEAYWTNLRKGYARNGSASDYNTADEEIRICREIIMRMARIEEGKE